MAIFPSIEPQKRTYGPGQDSSIQKDVVVNLTSTFKTGHPLSLEFWNQTIVECSSINNHFQAHQTTIEFTTPPSLWKLQADQYEVASERFNWRYSKPPTFTPLGAGFYNISVELISVMT